MFIEKIDLKLFKGFEKFSLDCDQTTVLVGPNSGGKTSVLNAIKLTFDIIGHAFSRGDINAKNPVMDRILWDSNPDQYIQRLSIRDVNEMWLNKVTSVPCEISIIMSDAVEIKLEMPGGNRYSLDILQNGDSLRGGINNPEQQQLVTNLFSFSPEYIPPVGTISPTELHKSKPQLQAEVLEGRFSECLRGMLFWQYNDGNKEEFDRVVEIVKSYIPDVRVLPPRLSSDPNSIVLVEFEENGTHLDLGIGGGGLKTLVNLATFLTFSKSRCLLLDEPDAHLHGSLQRRTANMLMDHTRDTGIQIFIATHSPDFISEVPLDSVLWIDREKEHAETVSEIGKALIDLGSISNADAVRAYGANQILFYEGNTDTKVLSRLIGMTDCRDYFTDTNVIKAKLPGGKGDKKYTSAFVRMLRETLSIDMKVACITDRDFDLAASTLERSDNTLIATLNRKEIENFLIEPGLIANTITRLISVRNQRTGEQIEAPNLGSVRAKIQEVMNREDVVDAVKYPLILEKQKEFGPEIELAEKLRQAEQWFIERWEDLDFCICYCPGKMVLGAIRKWSQDNYNISLSVNNLIQELDGCPDEVADILRSIDSFFYDE